MNHTICRLYKIENFKYPPEIDNDTLDQAIKPAYLAFKIKSLNEEINQNDIPKIDSFRTLLKGLTFYVSRETPYEILILLINS